MMKSFFKKLAFVMALAMVVTSAAPAANVFAAEFGIVAQDDKTWTVVETANVEVDEKADFKFVGAPSNWASLGFTWTSSDEDVATVNQAGVVTGVADGVAVITLADKAGAYVATLEVTVGEGEDTVNAYTVQQVNHNKVELTFEDAIEYTEADVELYRVFDGIETYWPIQNVKVNGNKLTFETYVNYEDGEEYVVYVAGDEGTAYTTTIGEVVRVGVDYGSVKNDTTPWTTVYPGKAYSNGEEGEEITVYLTAKLYNKFGVDVTDYYTTSDVIFELTEDNEDIMIDNYAGELVFYKIGAATRVKATYTYYDEEGEQHDIPSAATPIVSEKAPNYGIKKIDSWTIVKNGTPANQLAWDVHEIKAEDDARTAHHIVVKFTDTYGNQYVTDEAYANPGNKLFYAYADDSEFAEKGNYLTFGSSNTNKLLVGENDGSLTTYTKTSAAVVLTLRNYNSEKDEDFVRNVSAFKVDVSDKRKISKVTLKDTTVTVITDALEDAFEKKTTEVYVYDQYNTKWYANVGLTVSANVEGSPEVPQSQVVNFDAAAGKGTITVDGSHYANATKSTIYYTVKETSKWNSTTLKVLVKNPKLDNTTIKVTSYDLAVKSVDMVSNWYDGTDNKSTTIHYYELSNGCEVGHKDTVTLVASAGALKLTQAQTSVGTQFIVVYDKNGNVVPANAATSTGLAISNGKAYVTQVQPGEYTVHLAEPNGEGVMQYASTGDYMVKVLEVRGFDNKGMATFKTKYDEKFNVSNTNASVTLKKQDKVEVAVTGATGATFAEKVTSVEKTILKAAFSFKKGGYDWAPTDAQIADVIFKVNEGTNSIIITKVKFYIPVTNGNKYLYELTLNKAVEVNFN